MSVFIDTNVFVAYCNIRDINHKRAVKLMKKIEDGMFGEAYISDYVFDEIVTVAMLRTSLEKAMEIGEFLLNSDIEMLKVNDDVFNEAWEIFKEAKMSFTDCTIAATVKLFGIEHLASFDKGFRKFEWVRVIQ